MKKMNEDIVFNVMEIHYDAFSGGAYIMLV